MRTLPVLLLLVACTGHPGGDDAGIPCQENATKPYCCQGACNGDVGVAAVCDTDAGTWVCPEGSVSSEQCTNIPFCAH